MKEGPSEQTMTLRKRIMAEIENGPMTAKDLSKVVHISEKEILTHLGHVEKSLRPPMRLIIVPPVCNKCGFSFPHRHRFSKPSRCPMCRHEGIHPPAFQISRGN